MACFADSYNIMMFALVFIKPHDAVVGLCGFLRDSANYFSAFPQPYKS
jgi:hypothetical protein